MPHATLLCALLLLPGGPVLALENWTEFRGPSGQGLSTAEKLPQVWNRRRNVSWRREIPGKAWSSPIVYENKVYLTTAVEVSASGNQSLQALCLDAVSGEPSWDVEVFEQKATRIHQKNSHASPTPITDGDRLYVHFGTNGTACLDLDGKVVWRNRELVYRPVHGSGGSPALAGESLLISCDGGDRQFVVALDRKTGKTLWKTDRPPNSGRGFSFSTPLVIEVGGKSQVVSPGSDYVVSYDLKSGSEIWRLNYPGGYSVVPRPVSGHGLVFVCSGFDSPVLYAIHPDGSGDVTRTKVAWSRRRGVPLNPSPLLVGDELYIVNDRGVASCLDASTGAEHWQKRLGGNFSASPIYGDGKIYFTNEAGETIVIRAGKSYQELARCPLEERSLASLAVYGKALFIRTEKALYRVEDRSEKD